jgi:hypothetical protein
MKGQYEVEVIYHTPCNCKPGCTGVVVDRVKKTCEAKNSEDAERQFYALPDVVEILWWKFRGPNEAADKGRN